MKLLITLVLMLNLLHGNAQEDLTQEKLSNKIKTATSDLIDNVAGEIELNKDRRGNKKWGVHFNYSYLDTWIPSKWGFNAYYVESKEVTWDFEYLRGSLTAPAFIFDLGGIADKRYSLLRRSFKNRNSFHYLYGVYYNHLNIHLGDDLLSSISGDDRHKVDLVGIKVFGASWGIGNRWQTAGKFTWGIDWFTINMPLVALDTSTAYLDETSDSTDRKVVEKAIGILQDYPTFSILKLQVGISW